MTIALILFGLLAACGIVGVLCLYMSLLCHIDAAKLEIMEAIDNDKNEPTP